MKAKYSVESCIDPWLDCGARLPDRDRPPREAERLHPSSSHSSTSDKELNLGGLFKVKDCSQKNRPANITISTRIDSCPTFFQLGGKLDLLRRQSYPNAYLEFEALEGPSQAGQKYNRARTVKLTAYTEDLILQLGGTHCTVAESGGDQSTY